MSGKFPTKPANERFWALVDKREPDECWPWLGSSNALGYGQFIVTTRRGYKRVRTAPYRYSWEMVNGPMPAGTEPDHLCNNRNCVNPQHIEPVTHSENQLRSYQRGRKRGAYNPKPKPTHCPRGHEYTPENTYHTPSDSIYCRQCNRAACALRNARRPSTRRIRLIR